MELRLPAALRDELKEPMGTVYADAESLLAAAGRPVIAVGDVVTAHLCRADAPPAVAVLDGQTERDALAADVERALSGLPDGETVRNPAGTLTGELLDALATAVDGGRTAVVRVDGEEDLAALPAILLAPDGGAVVYGQPGEGMVLVDPDGAARERARDLLVRMDGPTADAMARLGVT